MLDEVTWLQAGGMKEKVIVNRDHVVVIKAVKTADPAIPVGAKTILCLSNGLVMPIAEMWYKKK